MGKDVGIAAVLWAGWKWVEVFGWLGMIVAAVAVALYIRLRMSDPYTKIDRLTKEVQRLMDSLSEERIRTMDLTNRNDELRTLNNRLHSELNEVRASMAELKKAFEKNGETIARLADDLKEEREKRDQQFMQWTREKAARGDL